MTSIKMIGRIIADVAVFVEPVHAGVLGEFIFV
jgi:hypothetical protein